MKEKRITEKTSRALPTTAQQQKKKPKISRALRRAQTLKDLKSAPKAERTGLAPDSCGKPVAPHNLMNGALASRTSHISKKRRRQLDGALFGQADIDAGSSEAHALVLD